MTPEPPKSLKSDFSSKSWTSRRVEFIDELEEKNAYIEN